MHWRDFGMDSCIWDRVKETVIKYGVTSRTGLLHLHTSLISQVTLSFHLIPLPINCILPYPSFTSPITCHPPLHLLSSTFHPYPHPPLPYPSDSGSVSPRIKGKRWVYWQSVQPQEQRENQGEWYCQTNRSSRGADAAKVPRQIKSRRVILDYFLENWFWHKYWDDKCVF